MGKQFNQQSAERVGKTTLPKAKTQGGHGKKNTPAGKFWHQGFGVITVNGAYAVPFNQQATAERIAALAATSTKRAMKVIPVQDFWAYTERT